MRSLFARLSDRLSRLCGCEVGSATLEFALLFPPVVLLMMNGAEAGLLNMRTAMLERGVEIAARTIRLGPTAPPTHAQLKAMICEQALILPDCQNSLKIELQKVTTTDWTLIGAAASCRDRSEPIKPPKDFTPGDPNDLMLVRVCLKAHPLFPTTGLGLRMPKDANGDYAAIVTTAFVNEP